MYICQDYAIGCTVTLVNSPHTEDDDNKLGIGVLDANYIEECAPGVTLSTVALPSTIGNSSRSNGLMILAQGSGQRSHLSNLELLKTRALTGCQDIKTILDHAVRHHLEVQSLPSLLNVNLD